MAEIITAFWLSFWLYKETNAADGIIDKDSTTWTLLNAGLFPALGFLIGNVGSSLASEFTFRRFLWPERYNHTKSSRRLAIMGLFMSATGPYQAAGKRTIDQFLSSGLFKGAKEGDMLGTAFFEDTEAKYTAFTKQNSRIESSETEPARNNFWGTVIAAVNRESPAGSGKDEEQAQAKSGRFSNRSISHLTLSNDGALPPTTAADVVHISPTITTMRLGALVSEASAILMGVITAAVWRTPFALVWFGPFLLELLAIHYRVRRITVKPHGDTYSKDSEGTSTDACVFVLDDNHGNLLIQSPKSLGLQFFRHFGHPQRSNLSLDRRNERVSMALVAALAAYFPTSWVAFVFASNPVRWTWIVYQLYNLIALVVLTYWDLLRVGSLDEEVARALQAGKSIRFGDDSTGYITVELEYVRASRVAEARDIVEAKKKEILAFGGGDVSIVQE